METMSTAEFASVVARLEKLEKENRRLKRLGVGVVLLGATALLMGGQATKTVEAEKFVLRDTNGRQRAALGLTRSADDPSVAFILYDEEERSRAALGVNKDGPGLYFTDPSGKHRAVLARNNEGIGFDLLDEKG